MMDRREAMRQKARASRAKAREAKLARDIVASQQLARVLMNARDLLTDLAFLQLVGECGTASLPNLADQPAKDSDSTGLVDRLALQFVVAWKFFYPLLAEPVFAARIEALAPGFIFELKDAFITLVVDGPFPHALSGHAGRRHGGAYYGESSSATLKVEET